MKTEKIFNFLYALGAAIVIFGAWQKITHRQLADIFLTIGLLTEVGLFVIMAFQSFIKTPTSEAAQSYPKIEHADNSGLTESVNNLNKTIKQVFNR
jgi:gliding motility-associated protein GldL